MLCHFSCLWNDSKQVTRGHNIVVDGWAGAANPHPTPLQTHIHTQKSIENTCFPTFQLDHHDRWTNGRTDEQSLL